jgi:hypothetical protein
MTALGRRAGQGRARVSKAAKGMTPTDGNSRPEPSLQITCKSRGPWAGREGSDRRAGERSASPRKSFPRAIRKKDRNPAYRRCQAVDDRGPYREVPMVKARPFNPAPRGPQSGPKREPPSQSDWVSIVDLERGMCRYPRDGKDGVEYCGAPAVPWGSSWCPAHHKLTCHASAISHRKGSRQPLQNEFGRARPPASALPH